MTLKDMLILDYTQVIPIEEVRKFSNEELSEMVKTIAYFSRQVETMKFKPFIDKKFDSTSGVTFE
jgi:hypothetical protein